MVMNLTWSLEAIELIEKVPSMQGEAMIHAG